MKQNKSQVSTEFFIFLGLAFLIAIIFSVGSLDKLNDVRTKKETDAVMDIALKLQREVLIAAYVEDGYSRSFQLPNNLEAINYSIRTQNSTIIIQSKKGFYSLPIPTVIGNFTKGTNIISKTNGVINVN
ncbi:MAG TPA: hypothetical protein VJI97_00930 [Candidatus Nanoarchaeia archaeon]|nr:hypothetical protein [Candidatus Nanoarchaeia archaeon]